MTHKFMRYFKAGLSLVILGMAFAGCVHSGHYGKTTAISTPLDCGAFEVKTFDSTLRSVPKRYGPGTYVGYIEIGADFSKGTVFTVFKGKDLPGSSLSEALYAYDPVRPMYLKNAVLLTGNYIKGDTFEAVVPEKAKYTNSNGSKITERPEIRIIGKFLKRGNSYYLFRASSDDYMDDKKKWETLRKEFNIFINSISWKT